MGVNVQLDNMEQLIQWLPVLIPLGAAQFVLMLVALIHVLKHPKYKMGNMALWAIVVVCVNLIGPILYFIIGKGDDEEED